jgi:hypothetical protein
MSKRASQKLVSKPVTSPIKKKKEKEEEEEEADVCPICHENLDNGQLTISLTNCGHIFHEDCIKAWMNTEYANSEECPMCKKPINFTQFPSYIPKVQAEVILQEEVIPNFEIIQYDTNCTDYNEGIANGTIVIPEGNEYLFAEEAQARVCNINNIVNANTVIPFIDIVVNSDITTTRKLIITTDILEPTNTLLDLKNYIIAQLGYANHDVANYNIDIKMTIPGGMPNRGREELSFNNDNNNTLLIELCLRYQVLLGLIYFNNKLNANTRARLYYGINYLNRGQEELQPAFFNNLRFIYEPLPNEAQNFILYLNVNVTRNNANNTIRGGKSKKSKKPRNLKKTRKYRK